MCTVSELILIGKIRETEEEIKNIKKEYDKCTLELNELNETIDAPSFPADHEFHSWNEPILKYNQEVLIPERDECMERNETLLFALSRATERLATFQQMLDGRKNVIASIILSFASYSSPAKEPVEEWDDIDWRLTMSDEWMCSIGPEWKIDTIYEEDSTSED